jgi:hypothetical protein
VGAVEKSLGEPALTVSILKASSSRWVPVPLFKGFVEEL